MIQAAKLAAERAKSGGSAAGGAIRRGGEAAGGVVRRGGEAVGSTVQSGREAGGKALDSGKQAASTAADKGRAAASAAVDKGKALSAELTKKASVLIPQRLESIGSPPTPLASKWGTGFGQFLGGMDGVPQLFGPLLGKLDKVGSVSVSPAGVEFDGESVPWQKVTAITLGSPIDAMTSKVAAETVERVRNALPAFPGRKLLVRTAVELMIALGLAVAKPPPGLGGEQDVQVVTSIRYGSGLRKKELRPGIFAILLSAMKPGVAAAIVESSRPHGAAVTVDPQAKAVARATAVLELTQGFRKQAEVVPEDEDPEEPQEG